MRRMRLYACRDRVYGSVMGAYAVDLLAQGKTMRVVAYRNGEVVDFDINEALAMKKVISEYEVEVAINLSANYNKNKEPVHFL